MGVAVTTGGMCMCTFGAAPGNLIGTSQPQILVGGKPVMTIKDSQPANITPFGMCSSLANPAVASATAAALGVLTPQPCTMSPAGTWLCSNTKGLAGSAPILTNDGKLMCAIGAGTISITQPGQMVVQIS